MSISKKTLTALKKSLVAGDISGAVDLGPEAFEALMAEQSPGLGMAFAPSWRVKGSLWPALYRTVLAVAFQLDVELSETLDPHSIPVGDTTIRLVRIPRGIFQMGMGADEVKYKHYVIPSEQRAVVLTRDYWVAQTLVTRTQWQQVMGEGWPGDTPATPDIRGAIAFCNRMSHLEGLSPAYEVDGDDVVFNGLDSPGYRLLTEAEWERAARANSDLATYAGNLGPPDKRSSVLEPIAWYKHSKVDRPQPVGGKLPNAFGLYDMLGNVDERCWRRYGDLSFHGETDPLGDTDPLPVGVKERFVVRGGNWKTNPQHCRCHQRNGDFYQESGFRIGRTASSSDPALAAYVHATSASSDWSDVALDLPRSRPRAMDFRHNQIFLGTAGGSTSHGAHALMVLDKDLSQTLHAHRTPNLVSTLVVPDRFVWMGLGPGYLWCANELGAEPPRQIGRFTNAPFLASHDGDLVMGTTYEGIFYGGERVAGMAGTGTSIAMDATHVYAAYNDYKVRAFDRANWERVAVCPAGWSVTAGAGVVVGSGGQGDTVTVMAPGTLEVLDTFTHPDVKTVRICEGKIVTRSKAVVQVQDLTGNLAFQWACPSGSYIDAAMWVEGQLLVGVSDEARNCGRILRFDAR